MERTHEETTEADIVAVSPTSVWRVYYLCSILDGCSCYIVNRDLRESMTEADIEDHLGATPRALSLPLQAVTHVVY